MVQNSWTPKVLYNTITENRICRVPKCRKKHVEFARWLDNEVRKLTVVKHAERQSSKQVLFCRFITPWVLTVMRCNSVVSKNFGVSGKISYHTSRYE